MARPRTGTQMDRAPRWALLTLMALLIGPPIVAVLMLTVGAFATWATAPSLTAALAWLVAGLMAGIVGRAVTERGYRGLD